MKLISITVHGGRMGLGDVRKSGETWRIRDFEGRN
ncbi:uncharacterized protein G2W53_036984 [Senna tora]|uniref:Uncharacterized protein n=1 Tax=Senna tora TaxID=362788 RepID=A0A834SWG2_9FABA|nr:uncharacterized protein G2W53_036984 [Senna tora]